MNVLKAPDPKLRIQTKLVKKIDISLISTLKEMVKLTKSFHDPEGVGLASTQVGLEGRFFVAKNDNPKADEFISVINPKILSTSKKMKKYFEGCLSIPNVWGEVQRHTIITVSYQDTEGKNITKKLTGVLAWIFQHETDHLNGVLFPQKVLEQKGRFFKFMGKDKRGEDIFEEINL